MIEPIISRPKIDMENHARCQHQPDDFQPRITITKIHRTEKKRRPPGT